MSAAEVIERIKALPSAEFEIVRQFVLNGATERQAEHSVRYATDDEFNAAMDHVFENHEELLRRLAQ